MRVWVCLPTYNERENLEPMLRALGEVLGPDDRVLVIDDSSPDGTGELADRLEDELALRRQPVATGAHRLVPVGADRTPSPHARTLAFGR